MLNNDILYVTLKDDGYWCDEDEVGWYGEFGYDGYGHILFNFYMNDSNKIILWLNNFYVL